MNEPYLRSNKQSCKADQSVFAEPNEDRLQLAYENDKLRATIRAQESELLRVYTGGSMGVASNV